MAALVQQPPGNGDGPKSPDFDGAVAQIAVQLTKLRDDIVAGNHPRLKRPNLSVNGGQESSAKPQVPVLPSSSANNAKTSTQVTPSVPAQSSARNVTAPNIPKKPPQAAGSSDIDPIFLTKSDVLVRAEIYQKRQRIERVLDEQNQRREVQARQKTCDQEAIPDFDVFQVLNKARDLVKPFKKHVEKPANRADSSSDSFDENTFYSSQMNESTSAATEDADVSQMLRPRKDCKSVGDGIHDPTSKITPGKDESQAIDLERTHADEQTIQRQNGLPPPPQALESSNGAIHHPVNNITSHAISLSKEEQIAQLEEQLRTLKEQHIMAGDIVVRPTTRENQESQEESAYSPPGPDEFGRETNLRGFDALRSRDVAQRPISRGRPRASEYVRRIEEPPSPLPNNVPIIRNHVTPLIAPQPARVSPLAVAKLPQVIQVRREHLENRRSSQPSNPDTSSTGQSPNINQQLRSSKKRRRVITSGENFRNVVPRREGESPEIRIKPEPVSPPLFNISSEVGRRHPAPLYIETAGPEYQPQDRIVYQPRAQAYQREEGVSMTPMTRRVISRNGHHYMANDEQDRLQVVSARQVRAPMSPAAYPVQYVEPQPRSVRAASQVRYVSPTGQGQIAQYREPTQPQPPRYIEPTRSPSPPVRQIRLPPGERNRTSMAPPRGRIVVDEYGRKFIEETIMPSERPMSTAPLERRQESDARYEMVSAVPSSVHQSRPVPRDGYTRRVPSPISRQAQPVSQDGYVRRVPSPSSPRYLQYPPSSRARQVIHSDGRAYDGASYPIREDDVRVTYAEPHSAGPFEEARQGIIRTQSVRPVNGQYEIMAEPTGRAPSAQPQRRIVSLDPTARGQSVRPQSGVLPVHNRHEMGSYVSRPMSVRPDDELARPIAYRQEERPRYQYTAAGQNGRFVEEVAEVAEDGYYDAARSQMSQRM